MSFIGDFMKALDGSDGIGRAASPLPGTSVAQPVVNQAFDFWVQFTKAAADGMASTATADTWFWSNPYDFPVYLQSAIAVATTGSLTADPTNFAQILIKTNNGAGGATAIGLTGNTTVVGTNTWNTNQPVSFDTVTGANIAVPAKGGLWFAIAKQGAGVVVPASAFFIRLRRGEY